MGKKSEPNNINNNKPITTIIPTITTLSTTSTTLSTSNVKEYKFFDFENKLKTTISNSEFKDITLFPNLKKKRSSKTLSSYANLSNKGVPFKSETFQLCDNSWQLLFIPHHKVTTSKDPTTEWLSVYLISNNINQNLKIDFSIELYNYKKAKTILKSKSFEFTKDKVYCGFNEYIKQNEVPFEDFYRPNLPAYYFSMIITIDKVIEENNRSISNISPLISPYQQVNETLMIDLPEDVNYYRSLLLSLYFIPIIREEVLRISPKDPEKMLYQLQRLFYYLANNKDVENIYIHKSIEYFIKSNNLNQFEYSKIVEKLVSEILVNSKLLQDKLLIGQLQLKSLNKFNYNESIFDSNYFTIANDIKMSRSLGGLKEKIIPNKTIINSEFMKSIESIGSSGGDICRLYINIPFGVSCSDSSKFQEKLLECNNGTLSKDSLQSILFISFLSKSLNLNVSYEQDNSGNNNELYNRFSNFKFPQEFTIFDDKVYSLYSVWSYNKHESVSNKNLKLEDMILNDIRPSGTPVTFIYDFNNKVWIKMTKDLVEKVSFNYVLENSCGFNDDRIINDPITKNLSRDLTFSYMLVYILKDKVQEFFNYKSHLPIIKYKELEELNKDLFCISKPTSKPSSLKPSGPILKVDYPLEKDKIEPSLELLKLQQLNLDHCKNERKQKQEIEELKKAQLQPQEQSNNYNNNNNKNSTEEESIPVPSATPTPPITLTPSESTPTPSESTPTPSAIFTPSESTPTLISSVILTPNLISKTSAETSTAATTTTTTNTINNQLIQDLLNKIENLQKDNFELNEKCKSLENINQEKVYIESQLENQLSKVDRLEKQLLFVDNVVRSQIVDVYSKWQDESKRYFEELQKLVIKYNELKTENQENATLKNQFYEEKMKLNEEKKKLIEINRELNEEYSKAKIQLSNTLHQIQKISPNIKLTSPSTHLIFDQLIEYINITEAQLREYDYSQVIQLEEGVNKLSERVRKELISKSECDICFDNKKEIAFVPCGHFSTCENCSKPFTECPFCRIKIQSKIKIKS